jgi:type II secretory pathway predicted ATPase ExeA
MFEQFYNFTKTPFCKSIPSEHLYRSNDSEELFERLKYTVQKQLFAVMLGDCGCGKTTTLRRFVDESRDNNFISLYLSDSKLTPRAFYKNLLEQLGFKAQYFRNDAKHQLHKEIEIMKDLHGTCPVVIVDEAHLINKEMLEEVRFLLNFKMDSQSPMALILSGQMELWDKLKSQPYAAIRQRVDIQCVVPRLDRADTNAYILSHLVFAGANRDIFTDGAIDAVFKFSDGIPRVINKACTDSLIYGAQNNKNLIDDRMVNLVVKQESIGGRS